SLEVAGQGRYQAESPEALLEEQLGWRLPVSHLLWWVRGLPAPDSKSRLTLDADSRLARLEQDGWQIEYTRYAEQNGYWLPERLKLHGQSLEVAGQGRYQAESPEALLEEQLGWRLPVSHLL
ncbi:lipoprotein insertase outer membrane protein LolB, partial [Klebsiella pneumoniae subsp. pneumoniae]